VADTWNHRIQHFTSEGVFLDAIGPFDEEGQNRIFWGPRAVIVDDQFRIFIADTGNHRIAIYNPEGEYLGEFGGQGFDPGQLYEPVGLAMDQNGRVIVADTWNHRVQVFEEINENIFTVVNEWTIDGWYGTSLENKPYIAVSPGGNVCLTDPEGYRVLCFTEQGEYLRGWGNYGAGPSEFGLPSGIAFDSAGRIWITDSGNNRLSVFEPRLE
jgi:DNA-binding beta-propeller fold protein YncE